MRLNRLELIKYGKFTDRSIDFPVGEHDFHFVVGPNEAGKSTLRAAVQELLFGIPTRSTMGFVHLQSDLRLGAIISDATRELSFHRAKAARNPLRTPSNEALSDQALQPFLGTADRKFFDQMFGLDHSRLIDGGRQILDASNDMGQILFQSAAGIASMGKIREALSQEADGLWAPRRAGTRDYYIAQDKFDEASAALKAAAVKAKNWADASSKVTQLAQSLKETGEAHQSLEVARSRLERLRRTSPFILAARLAEKELSAFAGVIDLPDDSAQVASRAQQEIAAAASVLELRAADTQRIDAQLAAVDIDGSIMAMSEAVDDLNRKRLQYAPYSTDLVRRAADIEAHWRTIEQECRSLQWDANSELALRERVPGASVRTALSETALAYSGLLQAVDAADEAQLTKQAELDALQFENDNLGVGSVPSALRAAVTAARPFADEAATAQKLESTCRKAEASLEVALTRLGQWRAPVPALEAMVLPTSAAVNNFVQSRQLLEAQVKAANLLAQADEDEVVSIGLEITQFEQQHQLTTAHEVDQRRGLRNGLWQAIKGGTAPLATSSGPFEVAMTDADQVADQFLGNVEQAAALQSLRHDHERVKLRSAGSLRALGVLEAALEADLNRWQATARAAGVADLPLELAAEWLVKRDKAIAASGDVEAAAEAVEAHTRKIHQAIVSLQQALLAAEVDFPTGAMLTALREHAEEWVQQTNAAAIRKHGLLKQLQNGATALRELKQTHRKAVGSLDAWQASWQEALGKVGLPTDAGIAVATRALDGIKAIDDTLGKISAIRNERIDTMNADLDAFAAATVQAALQVAPELAQEPAASVALTLTQRLTTARDASAEAQRLKKELATARHQEQLARENIETAKAALVPLLQRARVDTPEALQHCITQSDKKRGWESALQTAVESLNISSDGLPRERVEMELADIDLATVPAELARLQSEIEANVARQSTLSADHANAVRTLAEMAGSDSAATAEARRQEAISQMSDAAERYIKVATAAALLRWSIEQYREQKQGPMLTRASAIFSGLTLGAFKRLHVDFEGDAMRLEGQRAEGSLVAISGLSDGTRDQLYFALRLAALEMHLDQAVQLPFLADDLFVNYDDERSIAGLEALKDLSTKTQVIFLSHHAHLLGAVQSVFGEKVNVVNFTRESSAVEA